VLLAREAMPPLLWPKGAHMGYLSGERSKRRRSRRGYRRLEAAVIASAIRDLEKPTRAGGESYERGRLARAFMVVSNPKPGVLFGFVAVSA
jgi:hypothetical protein